LLRASRVFPGATRILLTMPEDLINYIINPVYS
jgi:hypothetical protein